MTRKKHQIWDDQYQKHHGNLADLKGHYEASFILQEILGPRPKTPLLDDIAAPEQLQKLEEERKEKDDILEDWHTPPRSPWERDPDQTVDTTSLSWDTDDINIPDSWDEGEETTEEFNTQAVTKGRRIQRETAICVPQHATEHRRRRRGEQNQRQGQKRRERDTVQSN